MRQRTSIAVIVIIVITAIIVTILSAMGMTGYSLFSTHERSRLHTLNAVLAEQAGTALAIPLWNFDRSQIVRTAESIMKERSVYAIVVRKAGSGEILLSLTRNPEWNVVRTDNEVPSGGLLRQEQNIEYFKEAIGKVQVFVTPRFLEEQLATIRVTIFCVIAGVATILTMTLYLLLWRIVIKPIKILEQFALGAHGESGDNSHIQTVVLYGELDSLRSSFIKMVTLLETRYIELQQESKRFCESEARVRTLNMELEQRVRERTSLLQRKTEELEQANEQLKEVDRLKSMFLASMSHELRTPLNAVIGFSTILLDEWLGPVNAEQKQNLASILGSGKHLLNMITDVLDVTQIEAGTIKPVIEEFDLYDLLTEAENQVSADMREKGLELHSELLRQRMRTDRRRLLQCVMNILNNAVKFTDKGSVTVEARIVPFSGETPEEEMVEIAVTDTGIGISEEDQSNIFQPFHRIVTPGRTIIPGTGLGLFLTRKIATEILKGDLLVSSEQGKGSRFSLKIPVRLP